MKTRQHAWLMGALFIALWSMLLSPTELYAQDGALASGYVEDPLAWVDPLGLSKCGPNRDASGGGGAANRALHERYVDGLRAAMERPSVHDAGLSRIIDDLYRPGARIGSGSTAAAVRREAATGARVGGRLHTQKAQESITRLQRWLDRNPTGRSGDRAAAENVMRDLQNALGGN